MILQRFIIIKSVYYAQSYAQFSWIVNMYLFIHVTVGVLLVFCAALTLSIFTIFLSVSIYPTILYLSI